MSGSWFDENFNDFSDEFFDDICDIKYYDFCLEDVEPNEAGEDWEAKFQNLEPPPLNVLTSFSSGLCFENNSNAVKVKKSSLVPCDESLQLKQWPSGSDLSNTVTPLLYDSSESKHSRTLQTCSPVSVLESSSSSCSGENPIPDCLKFVIPVKRPRSKRCCNRRCNFPPIFFPRASKRYHHLTASEIDAENYAGELRLNSAKKRQNKKKNLTQLSSEVEIAEPSLEPGGARKCTHCQVTRTPQWREGPMGPKTLCNACGVRYRSGRLFPEYRPAASPTFVPSAHSNSHRKVLEMRKKAGQVTLGPVMNPSILSAAEYSF